MTPVRLSTVHPTWRGSMFWPLTPFWHMTLVACYDSGMFWPLTLLWPLTLFWPMTLVTCYGACDASVFRPLTQFWPMTLFSPIILYDLWPWSCVMECGGSAFRPMTLFWPLTLFWHMTLAMCFGAEALANFNHRPLYRAHGAVVVACFDLWQMADKTTSRFLLQKFVMFQYIFVHRRGSWTQCCIRHCRARCEKWQIIACDYLARMRQVLTPREVE